MSDSKFTKIIKGEIPCFKIYEDDLVIVILDINPVSKGHSLIITKSQYENIKTVPDNVLSNIMIIAKKLINTMDKVLQADGYKIVQNNGKVSGQDIMHYHMHIVPGYETKDNNNENISVVMHSKNWIPLNISSEEMENIRSNLANEMKLT